MRKLLIDGDMVAFRNAVVLEDGGTIDWGDGQTSSLIERRIPYAKNRMDNFIERLAKELKADDVVVTLSSDPVFRLKVLPSYKENRKDRVRPQALEELKAYLVKSWKAIREPELEADDLMGILATDPSFDGERIIVSIDKDMRQIPGMFYNPYPHVGDPELVKVSRRDADRQFYYQILVGDTCDNYKGCPGIGPKKANLLLDEVFENIKQERAKFASIAQLMEATRMSLWAVVMGAFEDRGLTEADALVQARVARICQHEDWSKEEGVKLWTPPNL